MKIHRPNPARIERFAVRHGGKLPFLLAMAHRFGAATVETAVCLPFLIIMVFSSVELSGAVFLKHSVDLAAYEGARTVTRPGENATKAAERVAQILASRRVTNYTYSCNPPVTASTPRGTPVEVTVTAPAGSLSIGPLKLLTGKTMSARFTMARM
ncbi:MAG: TadE/TadG family type IV pilus assembly protein [Planctomycetaceae bacterium]